MTYGYSHRYPISRTWMLHRDVYQFQWERRILNPLIRELLLTTDV